MVQGDLSQGDEAHHLALDGAAAVGDSIHQVWHQMLLNHGVVKQLALVSAHHAEDFEGAVDVLLVSGLQGLAEQSEDLAAEDSHLEAEV